MPPLARWKSPNAGASPAGPARPRARPEDRADPRLEPAGLGDLAVERGDELVRRPPAVEERPQEEIDTAAEHGALTLADQEHRLLVTTELDVQVVLELQGAAGALDALEARGAWDALHEHRTLMDKAGGSRPPETPVLVRNSASAGACPERGRARRRAAAARGRARRAAREPGGEVV